jgi:hypothetical protein
VIGLTQVIDGSAGADGVYGDVVVGSGKPTEMARSTGTGASATDR